MTTAIGLCRRIAMSLTLGVAGLTATAQVGEYFWNSDPGIGRGNRMSAESTANGSSTFTIDASALATGLNVLGMRAFSNGRWSQTYITYVMVDAAPLAPSDYKGEYYWDSDPGIGKATPMTFSASGEQSISEIACDGLTAGVHTLGMRVTNGGLWSPTQTYLVLVPATASDNHWIVEYFCDSDPGIGKATRLDGALVGEGGTVNIDILAEDLEPGTHTLGFRATSGGPWSQTVIATVTVPDPRRTTITAAEYFWGEDPGFGNGTPIEITPGEEVSVEALELDFPAEKADEYVLSFRAHSEQGWGTTVTKVIPHLYVEQLTLSDESLTMITGTTAQLDVEMTPADAFVADLLWTSSDPTVASVDETGFVNALADGTAEITVAATDGSEVKATCVVTVFTPPMGDSNANGTVNIADAVNTANYAVGNEVESFYFAAADVNVDNKITLSDASGTVTIILEQPSAATAMAKIKAMGLGMTETGDALVTDDYTPGAVSTVGVRLDDTRRYVALQADITLPEGMTLEGVNAGGRVAGHSLIVKRMEGNTVRVVLFDLNNKPFADNDGTVIELVVRAEASATGDIVADYIIASDGRAKEYVLGWSGGHSGAISGVDGVDAGEIHIEPTHDGVAIFGAANRPVAVYAVDGTTVCSFVATTNRERVALDQGVYVVVAGEKATKVMVK